MLNRHRFAGYTLFKKNNFVGTRTSLFGKSKMLRTIPDFNWKNKMFIQAIIYP